MSTLTIYGASDDLVEVEGSIEEEFSYSDAALLAISDGTLLRIEYTRDGVWRITVLATGRAQGKLEPNSGPDSDSYTDRLTLELAEGEEFRWVVFGTAWAKP